ncbi:hypothetical protein MNB_SUP05-5-1054 [hydrothermal vent metagenome]|uniref:YcfA family protein n=1 Tax=hydrothermal vent metagenome TaxID=652676 RepID=A0A1W1CHF3_9ZZZZ
MAKKGYTHKITPIKPNKAIKIFEKLGFQQFPPSGGGSHIPMKRNKDDNNYLVLVKHGEINPLAMKKMLKNIGITEKQYLDVFNSL